MIPRREVVKAVPARGGCIVQLSCGHGVYYAGKSPGQFFAQRDGFDVIDTVPCRTGPCYAFGMGLRSGV